MRASRTTVGAVVVAATGLLLAGLVAPATAATSTGNVKGTVKVGGKPLAGAKVQLYRNVDSDPGGDGDEGVFTRVKTVKTSKAGRYSFSGLKIEKDPKYGLEINQYRVVVSDRTGQGVRTVRIVKSKKGKTVTRNVTMPRAGTIRGTVARADGGTPTALTVAVDETSDSNADELIRNPQFSPDPSVMVRGDGSFTLKGLPRGTYGQVSVSGGPYAEQCYDLSTSTLADCASTQAQEISVAAGKTRTLPSVTVTKRKPPVSTLKGTVTDSAGRPLKGVKVELYPVGGSPLPSDVVTRSTGRFAYKTVKPGRYTVRLTDTVDGRSGRPSWQRQFVGGMSERSARVVTVADGKTVTGLDQRLKSDTSNRIVRKGGKSTASFAFDITRLATGSKPGGTVSVETEKFTASTTVVRGTANIRVRGLSKGDNTFTVRYSGTGSTAGFTKVYTLKIG